MPKSLPNGVEANFDQYNAAALAMAQPHFNAMVEFNGKLCETAARFGAEWTDFMTKRLREDFAASQRLLSCRTPQDMQQVYADWWSKAFGQYQQEFGRLAKLGETLTGETVSVMQEYTENITREARRAA